MSAQYESWSLPLSIILIVPMCLLAALVGIFLAKLDVNIFVQIGLIVLIGLAAKNAILIVEFAKQLEDTGKPRFEATVDACRLRLRPILMTSFAFILGVVPLVLAKGAGAEMRFTLGLAVFSGMLGVTSSAFSSRRFSTTSFAGLPRGSHLQRIHELPDRTCMNKMRHSLPDVQFTTRRTGLYHKGITHEICDVDCGSHGLRTDICVWR